MKRSIAFHYLEIMTRAIQRLRSILAESEDEYAGNDKTLKLILKEINQEMHPYVFDKKCPLPTLLRVLDAGAEKLEPQLYANLMFIALRLEPVIGVVAAIENEDDFPKEWSGDMVRAFDPE